MKADDRALQAAYILTWGLVPIAFYMIMATWWLLTGRTNRPLCILDHAQMVEYAIAGAFIGLFIIIMYNVC